MMSAGRRTARRVIRLTASGLALVLVVAALTAAMPPPAYTGQIWSPFPLPATPSVPGQSLPPGADAAARARAASALSAREPAGTAQASTSRPASPVWPAASPVTMPLSAGQAGREAAAAGQDAAGHLPVQVTAVGQARAAAVTVQVSGHAAALAAGVSGVLMTMSASGPDPAASRVQVRLDYATFAGAYGGAWSSRLRLVELPLCALSDPHRAACRTQTPLSGTNDAAASTVSASLTLPPAAAAALPVQGPHATASQQTAMLEPASGLVVLAAAAGPAGPAGSYQATPLKASGTWAAQEGDFTYSYPITVPPALGGDAPDVALSYDSQSVDSETSAANTQGGWIGDGWDYSPGFIERSYQPCSQDGIANSGDMCWGGYNGTLSLGGRSSVLVKDGSTGAWHLQGDDGSKVQLLSGASNGLWNGEYWLVTTTDGTKYYFGQNHLPGGGGTDAATNSAWGLPVYNPGAADPCHSLAWCQMGWRWNLDYVVDPAGNLTVYDYAAESNDYSRGGGQNAGNGTLTPYTRGGYPTSASYGWLLTDAIAGARPAAQIQFGPSDRCLSAAATCDANHTATYWPDVPWDQNCGTSGSCTNYAPTFWTTQRLTSITTQVLEGSTYQNVDSYALAQTFPAAAGSNNVIFLNSITRTGQDGTSVSLPPVSFGMIEIDNRIDGLTPSAPPVDRPRISGLTTEAGAQLTVLYKGAACSRVNHTMPATADTNTMPCFPVYWTPPGLSQIQDWFNKSLIAEVDVNDVSGAGSPTQVTKYSYLGGAAWHQDDSPVVPSATRTWDQFRGYAQVDVTTGAAPDPITQTRYTYLRGMDGDGTSSGGTKSVTVTDPNGDPAITDSNWLAGQVLETDTYTQSGGSVAQKAVSGPWTYSQTASQSEPSGLPSMTAHMLAQSQARTISKLASGSWRTDQTTTYYDSDARAKAVDSKPDGSAETCTSTSYATPPSGNPMMDDYPQQATVVTGAASAAACPAASSANIVSDTRTYYDDESATLASMGTLGSVASPGGLATGTQQAAGWPSGSESWLAQSVAAYDPYGRVISATDADGNVTKTAYSPAYTKNATATLPARITVTNPQGWTTVTTLDQARQLPLTVTDVNGEVTTEQYDSLGRLAQVWLPIDPTSGPASYTYAYSITGTSRPAVTTSTLRGDGSYSADVKIYDGLLQLRQEQQTPAPGGTGRLITDDFYDSHGWPVKTRAPYYDATASPGTGMFVAQDGSIPGWTLSTYDGQGRVATSQFFSGNTRQWQTTTAYPGADETDVTPPAGGTATSTFTNALGQTTASWAYTTATPDGTKAHADVTSYTYSPAGQTATVADNAGNTWRYTYNLLGEKTAQADPGAGTTSYAYDPAGNLTSSTDARGQTLTWAYDSLGRKTAEYSGTTSGTQLASWTYDTAPLPNAQPALGQPATSTAYTTGASGPAYVEAITGYNSAYQPAGTATTIPAAEGKLAGTYTTANTYGGDTSLLTNTGYSADGGLPLETVNYSYDLEGLLAAFGGNTAYLDLDIYDALGQLQRTTFGLFGKQLVQTYAYDAGTNRLLTSTTNLQTLSAAADTDSYTYNPAGNITSASDAQNTGGTNQQCYTYDNLGELTQAWSDTKGTTTAAAPSVAGIGGCTTTTPSAATIGGPAPYWQSYTYDLLGDRTGQTVHATTGVTANNITQALAYPGNGTTAATQPDAPTQITTTGPNGTTTTTPHYDAAGDTTSRTATTTGTAPPAGPPSESALTYNPQGQTATVTAGGQTASYLYDASGNLLIQRDPAATTLYLDGGAEQLTLAGTTVTGQRFYPSPDGVTIVRSSTGTLSYEITNPQHTANEAIDTTPPASLAITRRYYDPYGDQLGTPPATWPDNHAYLSKPADPATSLDLLGARQYDPATGRFLTLDPDFEAGSPTQMGGYAYAANSPISQSDPTGLCVESWCPPPPVHGTNPDPSHYGPGQGTPPGGGHVPPLPNGGGGGYTGPGRTHTSGHTAITTPTPPGCNSVASRLGGGCTPSMLVGGDGSFSSSALHFLGNVTGVTDVIGCINHPTFGGCLNAAAKVALDVAMVASLGGTTELDIGLDGAEEAAGGTGSRLLPGSTGTAPGLPGEIAEPEKITENLHSLAETGGHAADRVEQFLDQRPVATGSLARVPAAPAISPATGVGNGFSFEGALMAATMAGRAMWLAIRRAFME